MSLLLGAVFVATPMAETAYASASTPQLLANPFPTQTAEKNICFGSLPESVMAVSLALVPPQFEQVDIAGVNKLVITAPKDETTGSFTPVETVLKKVTDEDTAQDVVVTPSPTLADPTVTPTPVTYTPTTVASSSNGSVLNSDVLFNLVNGYRASLGLAPFQKIDQICSVANSRAPEIDSEIWVTHTMHAGFYARNLPFWATENLISMQNEQEALNWWIHSPVHNAALTGNYKYACTACSGRSCSMIFSNLEPKYVAPQIAQQNTPTPATSGSTPAPASTVQAGAK